MAHPGPEDRLDLPFERWAARRYKRLRTAGRWMEQSGVTGPMTNKIPMKALLAVAGIAMLTSGCGIGRAVGGGKNAPDEFAIATKAPLVVPPDYSLRPPKPGETRPAGIDAVGTRATSVVGGRQCCAANHWRTAVAPQGRSAWLGWSNSHGACCREWRSGREGPQPRQPIVVLEICRR